MCAGPKSNVVHSYRSADSPHPKRLSGGKRGWEDFAVEKGSNLGTTSKLVLISRFEAWSVESEFLFNSI